MEFKNLVNERQPSRSYDKERMVEKEKIKEILEIARLSPSACNGQPYFITVASGEAAKSIAKATQGMGMNGFASDAPVMLVISEEPYVKTAALGAKLKKNDYRSIDIGILAAHITLAATENGLGTCILGWFDDQKIREICQLSGAVRLVITLGYPKEGDKLRKKIRKDEGKLIKEI